MTQRTINLYDGLEALYYFDSDYYDGTTGEIKDKSGHGRHATAFGGPTVGVNGPNDFEATSFDGSDDGFRIPNMTFQNSDPWTVVTFMNWNGGSPWGRDKNGSFTERGGKVKFRTQVNSKELTLIGSLPNGWKTVSVSHEPYDKLRYKDYDNGKLERQGEIDISTIDMRFNINEFGNSSLGRFNGQMAFGMIWRRRLTEAERLTISKLTAPRRSQL